MWRLQLYQLVEHLGVQLPVVDLPRVVYQLVFGHRQTDVPSAARGIGQRVRVVRRGHERGIAGPVLLTAAEDGSSVHLALRQRLLQRRMLTRSLVREVQVVEVVLSEMRRKDPCHERRLTAALGTDERGYAFVTMNRIHLQPVGHGRAQPGGQIAVLLAADAGQPAEQCRHMVLSVPLGQVPEEVLYRIECGKYC